MEERLKVEVQISSYDAKGLQCFVAEQIQKYRPEEDRKHTVTLLL